MVEIRTGHEAEVRRPAFWDSEVKLRSLAVRAVVRCNRPVYASSESRCARDMRRVTKDEAVSGVVGLDEGREEEEMMMTNERPNCSLSTRTTFA